MNHVLDPQTLCGERHNGYDTNKPAALCPLCNRILAWNYGAVRRVAESIFERRAWEEMPVLADALEEALHAAGCENAAILEHCRATAPVVIAGAANVSTAALEAGCDSEEVGRVPAVHGRGCWVVNLMLGRK